LAPATAESAAKSSLPSSKPVPESRQSNELKDVAPAKTNHIQNIAEYRQAKSKRGITGNQMSEQQFNTEVGPSAPEGGPNSTIIQQQEYKTITSQERLVHQLQQSLAKNRAGSGGQKSSPIKSVSRAATNKNDPRT